MRLEFLIRKTKMEIARGLSNYDSEDLLKIMGKSSDEIRKIYPYLNCEEAVHKDNLVIIK
jgi:glutamate 5-kinase